jgi:hypothetical protein
MKSKLLKEGDIVKWHEVYGDAYIVKDCGIGIILQKIEFDYGFPTGPYINYKVHRAKHNDIVLFEQENLEKIKGEENND